MNTSAVNLDKVVSILSNSSLEHAASTSHNAPLDLCVHLEKSRPGTTWPSLAYLYTANENEL